MICRWVSTSPTAAILILTAGATVVVVWITGGKVLETRVGKVLVTPAGKVLETL